MKLKTPREVEIYEAGYNQASKDIENILSLIFEGGVQDVANVIKGSKEPPCEKPADILPEGM